MLTALQIIEARVASEQAVMDPAAFLTEARRLKWPLSCVLDFEVDLRRWPGDVNRVKTKFIAKLYKDGDGYSILYRAPQDKMQFEIKYDLGGSVLVVRFESDSIIGSLGVRNYTWIIELTGAGDPSKLFKSLFGALNRALNSSRGQRFPVSDMWREVEISQAEAIARTQAVEARVAGEVKPIANLRKDMPRSFNVGKLAFELNSSDYDKHNKVSFLHYLAHIDATELWSVHIYVEMFDADPKNFTMRDDDWPIDWSVHFTIINNRSRVLEDNSKLCSSRDLISAISSEMKKLAKKGAPWIFAENRLADDKVGSMFVEKFKKAVL